MITIHILIICKGFLLMFQKNDLGDLDKITVTLLQSNVCPNILHRKL